MDCVLAIDQGTHATRAVLFDMKGEVLAHHEVQIDLYQLSPGHTEVAPEQVLASVRDVIQEACAEAPGPIRCAGLAVQRSTLVAWDAKNGVPLAPGISWQDTRSSPITHQLHMHEQLIHQVSGLPLSPHYLAGKMRWLLEENEAVIKACSRDRLLLGPLASYLAFNLLQGNPAIADHSNAARSMMFNLEHCRWSKALMGIFHILPKILPKAVPTLARHGVLENSDIPLTCLCGDQNAAIHSHGAPPHDHVLVNLGSGAFVLRSVGDTMPHHPSLISGIAWSKGQAREYCLEGAINGVGNALRWLQVQTNQDIMKDLPDWLSNTNVESLFLNSVGGLGSPYWNENIEPRFVPETDSMACRAVALVESIAFLVQRNLEEMGLDGIESIDVSGGLSRLDGLCQRISDLSQRPLLRHRDPEATARGLAWLAADMPQGWPQETEGTTFTPKHDLNLRGRYLQFLELVDQEVAANPGLRTGPT